MVVRSFEKSLNYKSGLGFFVPALEVPFFEVPTRAFLAKVAIFEGPKNGTSSVGTKNPTPLL